MSSSTDSQNRSGSVRAESTAECSSSGEGGNRWQVKRRGKRVVESSSSEEVVEALIRKAKPATQKPFPVEPFVHRPPLLRVKVPVDNIESEIREADLQWMRIAYNIPDNIEIAVPPREFKASRPPVGWFCCYEEQLRGGLRFPIHPFLSELLTYYRVPLSQIVPNGVRIMVFFLLSCKKKGVAPTIGLFRYFFQLKKAPHSGGYMNFSSRGAGFKVDTPDNNTGWKPRFLLFRMSGVANASGLNLLEEWNYAVAPDQLSKEFQKMKPTDYQKLVMLDSVDGKTTDEVELLQHGLSLSRSIPSTRIPKSAKVSAATQVVKVGDMQEATAERALKRGNAAVIPAAQQKKNPVASPVPMNRPLIIHDAPATRVGAPRIPEKMNSGDKGKGKEVVVAEERPLKRPRTKMTVLKNASGETEITRAEFDGAEILNLYSGDTLILPSADKSAVEVQHALRGFIPQALLLANDVTVQFGKMANRIEELELEVLKLKEKEVENSKAQEIEKKLATALHEKSVILEEKVQAEQARAVEQMAREASDKTRQLVEKEAEGLRARVAELQSQQMNPGAFARILIKKLQMTRSFGELMAEMCEASTMVGIHKSLVHLLQHFPGMRLRKKEFGWDPYCSDRVNQMQIKLCKGEREYPFITALEKLAGPISLAQLEALDTDYDFDLDKSVGPTPDVYVCEDDDEEASPSHSPADPEPMEMQANTEGPSTQAAELITAQPEENPASSQPIPVIPDSAPVVPESSNAQAGSATLPLVI